jgi:predicted RNase H-like HicB family nuclease
MKYAIVIEKVPNSNYGAYAPDVDGCVATGNTLEEVKQNMKEALEFHFEGTREDGLPIPAPSSEVAYIDVEVPAPVSHDVPAI